MSVSLGNLQHVADISSSVFERLPTADDGEWKSVGTLKINHNTFNVSVVDGKVDVSFKSGNFFTNLFRGDTLRRAETALRDAYASFVGHQSEEESVVVQSPPAESEKTEEESVVVQSPPAESEKIEEESVVVQNPPAESAKTESNAEKFVKSGYAGEVAHYGFADPRGYAMDDLVDNKRMPGAQHVTIDRYNTESEILFCQLFGYFKTVRVENLAKVLNTIGDNAVSKSIPDENLKAWHNYLKKPENMRKLDVIGKLKEDILEAREANGKTTGWAAELRRLGELEGIKRKVMKNLTDPELRSAGFVATDEVYTAFAIALRDLALLERQENESDEDFGKRRQAVVDDALDKHCATYKNKWPRFHFDVMISSMFFRQTSKMGLEFFSQRKTPVLFQWKDYNGKKIDENTIQNKWWKDEKPDPSTHYGASITYSEMRHVVRHEKEFTNVIRNEG